MWENPMRRRLALACLVLLLLIAGSLRLVHAPPVRSLALRYAIRTAASQGIQVEAQRLDYNLATRRVRLVNVRLSGVGDTRPFFTADSVEAITSPRLFFGEIA